MTSNIAFETFIKNPIRIKCEEAARKLAHMQGGHNKFLETITLILEIKAPRYWWQEFDTYRVGVTKQSESTIHTITKKALGWNDFEDGTSQLIINLCNDIREKYNNATDTGEKNRLFFKLKANLPESFFQRRVVSLNVKTLQNMYNQRKNHKLPQWKTFFSAIAEDLEKSQWEDFINYCIFKDDLKVFIR